MKLIGSRITVIDPLSTAIVRLADMISDNVDEEVDAVLDDAADKVAKRAKEGISRGPKTGRRYKRGKNRWHIASAQSEYPASDTGNLVRSIHVEKDERLKAWVVSDAEYAKPLEYKPPSKGGRPFLRRALDETTDEIVEDVFRAVFRAF